MKNLEEITINEATKINGGYGYYPGQEKDAAAGAKAIKEAGEAVVNFVAGFFGL